MDLPYRLSRIGPSGQTKVMQYAHCTKLGIDRLAKHLAQKI